MDGVLGPAVPRAAAFARGQVVAFVWEGSVVWGVGVGWCSRGSFGCVVFVRFRDDWGYRLWSRMVSSVWGGLTGVACYSFFPVDRVVSTGRLGFSCQAAVGRPWRGKGIFGSHT